MKWLEGWFGTMSGVLGIVSTVIISLVAVASVQSSGGQSCMTTSDGQTTCSTMYGPGYSPPAPQPNVVALILLAVIVLLFIGVLVGTWLDLRGRRLAGRLILLMSVSLLMVASLFGGGASHLIGVAEYAYLIVLFALITGVLACLRRDEPRVAAALIPPQQAPVTE